MKKTLNQLFFFLPSLLPYHCFYHELLAVLGFCFFSWISEIIKWESRAEFPADSGRLPWGSKPYIPGFPLLLFCLHYRASPNFTGQGFSLWPLAHLNLLQCKNKWKGCTLWQWLRPEYISLTPSATLPFVWMGQITRLGGRPLYCFNL